MRDVSEKPSLDPLSRCSEAIFGLLMALSFTGAVTIASEGEDWIRQVIVAAVTCNIAWGLTDAAMHLLSTRIERARRQRVNRDVMEADPKAAIELARAEFADWANVALSDQQIGQMIEVFRKARATPDHQALLRGDLKAAVSVLFTVVLATCPPILPLILVGDPELALRMSNLVSVLFLVFLGAILDRLIGARLRYTLVMPLVGAALVAVIVALGG